MHDSLLNILNKNGGVERLTFNQNEQEFTPIARGHPLLLVEDNDLNQQIANEILTEFGFSVEIANNGAIACEMIASRPYVMVLMDMQMPVMDGIEATKVIRRDVRYKDLPIIAMTANVLKQDLDRCLEAGMSDYVTKPIQPVQLYKILRRWMGAEELAISSVGDRSAVRDSQADSSIINDEIVNSSRQYQGSFLDKIDGLNVQDGLRRVLGRVPAYINILKSFVSNHGQSVERIREAYQNGDITAAKRTLHTLKGLAGSIGAMQLAMKARQLEESLGESDHTSDLDVKLDALDETLSKLLLSINEHIPADKTTLDAASVDGADFMQIKTVCEQLTLLLSNDDGEAEDLFRAHQQLFSSAFPEDFEALKCAIEAVEYKKRVY